MPEEELGNFECFYGIVLRGRLKSLAAIRNYISKFSDAHIVYDRTSPIKLYILVDRGGGAPK